MRKESVDAKIDKLALAVGNGFKEVHQKFDAIDENFNGIREELKIVNFKLDKLDAKLTGTNGRVEVLEDQMRVVRTKLNLT